MNGILSVFPEVLPAILLICGTYYLINMKFFFFVRPIKTLKMMFSGKSQIKELSLSLAGTLGVGNIVGVAVAIKLGGSGAVFWMWLSALVSMILKFAEITLAVKYRENHGGKILGGPMYYMKNGICGKFGKSLAVIFAALGVILSFILGNLTQTGAATYAVRQVCDAPKLLVGISLGVLCAAATFGGYESASKVTSFVVPLMSAMYIFAAAKIVISNFSLLPGALSEIFRGARSSFAAGGGILGFFSSKALTHGVSKGAYSHEAGAGTASMSHAQTSETEPCRQGLLGLFEVFFDTLVICTLTALVIIMYGDSADSGMALVGDAFAHFIPGGRYIVCVSVIFFAFSTLICWGYYGRICLEYLVKSKAATVIFSAIYSAFVIFAATVGESRIWVLTDFGVALLTFVNLIALILLSDKVKSEARRSGLIR
ncbi:MAG: sodium:alanine symporter family protein [Clostridiales bacterium]|nr:sodium:alanine symporter family protein [Clostridiales bacterium]